MFVKGVLGVAAGVAVLAGLGWLTQEEETKDKKKEEDKQSLAKKTSAFRTNPPFEAPDGFTWHEPRCFYILLLVPEEDDEWVVREDEAKTCIYVTKRNAKNATATPPTSFTVTCMQHKPKDYVLNFLKSYPGVLKRFGKQNIGEWETKELRGHFVKHTITFEDTGHSRGELFIVSNLILNETTGTVYLVMFEAPKSKWDEAWATYGEVMTNNLLLPSSL